MPDTQEGSPEPLDPLDRTPGVATPPTLPDQPHEDTQPLLLVVPWLHPEMEPVTLPAAVRFFNPGVGPASIPVGTQIANMMANPMANPMVLPGGWRPADAPLSEAMASAFLRETAAFARERGGSRGSLNVNALTGNDFYAGSALSIQSELTGGSPRRDDPAVRSQQLLLLAWQVEEQKLELRSLDQHVQAEWRELDAALGVDDMDERGEIEDFSGGRLSVTPEDRESTLPWRLILEALLFFVPQETLLVTSHREIIEALLDTPDCPRADLPGNVTETLDALLSNGQAGMARIVRAPGWKLVGAVRCPTGKPWLERERVLICLDPDGSGTRAGQGTGPGKGPGKGPGTDPVTGPGANPQ